MKSKVKEKSGYGTNFHKVYKNSPNLYHRFSSAEFFSVELNDRLKGLFKGEVLLDIACGTCHKTNLISGFFKTVYALDKSKPLLDFARNEYWHNRKIQFINSSGDKIPLPDESVDTIFISWGSFPLQETIKEMKRVLSPGGVILRIGIFGIDEYTKMFPELDLGKLRKVKKVFKSEGFNEECHYVQIRFTDILESKFVLSRILKVDPSIINSVSFKHKVNLNYYQKVR